MLSWTKSHLMTSLGIASTLSLPSPVPPNSHGLRPTLPFLYHYLSRFHLVVLQDLSSVSAFQFTRSTSSYVKPGCTPAHHFKMSTHNVSFLEGLVHSLWFLVGHFCSTLLPCFQIPLLLDYKHIIFYFVPSTSPFLSPSLSTSFLFFPHSSPTLTM